MDFCRFNMNPEALKSNLEVMSVNRTSLVFYSEVLRKCSIGNILGVREMLTQKNVKMISQLFHWGFESGKLHSHVDFQGGAQYA